MMISRLRTLLLAFAAMITLELGVAHAHAGDVMHIAIVGDSTVREYNPKETSMCGWGQLLRQYVDPAKVQLDMCAYGGSSSKNYLHAGYWSRVMELSPAPKYILIQFGHGDFRNNSTNADRDSTSAGRMTLPGEVPKNLPADGLGSQPDDWYRNNIRTYIEQARKIGAVPIIITPMEANSSGMIKRKYLPWAEGAIDIARELQAPVIDLNGYSADLLDKLNAKGGCDFMHFVRKDGAIDKIHHNEVGARIYAEFIAAQLAQIAPELQSAIKLPKEKVADAYLEAK